MRILLIGATGTIGRAIDQLLTAERHDVVRASHKNAEHRVDIADPASLRALYKSIGRVDAIVSAAGSAAWKPLAQLTDADWQFSLGHKLMGQVNVLRLGLDALNDGGSVTLTSGILASEPSLGSAAVSVVNAGVEAFARAAALDLERGIRINVVSPPWVSETLASMGQDPAGGLPAADVARTYVAVVTGRDTGRVVRAA